MVPLDIGQVGLVVGAVAGVVGLWAKYVWPFTRAVVHLAEAVPVLTALAEEFGPGKDGKGSTLREEIDVINVRLGNVEQQIEAALTQD